MSLKVWLPLNGDLHNQGCSPFTITSIEATPTFTAGKIGQCYQRTDSNAQVTKGLKLDDNLINTFGSQASVAVWVKPLGTHTHYNGTILSSGNWNAKKWAFGVSQDNTKVDVLCGSYNNYITCDVPVNVWTHLVSIYDNGTCTLYKNGIYIGQLVNQKAFETDADWTGICRETYASGYFGFNGCINDLRIYDHCLSAAEVKEIAQGLVLHYKLDASSEEKITTIPSTNVYSYPTFNTSAATGGWNHWGSSGHSGSYGQNTDKKYIYNKNNTYSHWITEDAGTGKYYLLYQGPAFEGGYRSLQAIIKEENGLPITESICYPNWNARNGGVPKNKWTSIKSLGDGFYYCCCEGVSQDGSNDLIGIIVQPGYKIYVSECYLENNTEICSPIFTYSSNIVQDSSGYNYNGTVLGAPIINNDTIKYSSCISFPTNADGILSTFPLVLQNNAFTYSFWIKPSGENGGRSIYAASYSGTSCSIEKTAGNKLRFYWNGSPDLTTSSLTITDGVWQHIAIVKSKDKTKVYCYYNGELKDTFTNTFSDKAFSGNLRIARDTRGDATSYTGLMSDFRIYCTPLLDTDIKSLYNNSMKIDNLQNIHTFELNENGTNKLTKAGILYDNIVEPYLTLPDGSYWKLMLFHYVNNGNNLFTKANATYCNDFGLYSRLKDIANYTYNNKYEYYVIQDGKEFRWTQTSSPTATSITGLTTVSGYNNPVNGLAKPSSLTQTYIGYNSWWGACGCWTKYSTGGKTGIPGFGSHDGNGICTNYLALYTRIEKPKIEIANENIYTESLIEF